MADDASPATEPEPTLCATCSEPIGWNPWANSSLGIGWHHADDLAAGHPAVPLRDDPRPEPEDRRVADASCQMCGRPIAWFTPAGRARRRGFWTHTDGPTDHRALAPGETPTPMQDWLPEVTASRAGLKYEVLASLPQFSMTVPEAHRLREQLGILGSNTEMIAKLDAFLMEVDRPVNEFRVEADPIDPDDYDIGETIPTRPETVRFQFDAVEPPPWVVGDNRRPIRLSVTADEAVGFAAWLVAVADPDGHAFERVLTLVRRVAR